jgi:hypothetical protein
MRGFVCDKCGAKAPVHDVESNQKLLSDGWATMVSAVDKNQQMDLCPSCNKAWDKIRQETIRRWMAGQLD